MATALVAAATPPTAARATTEAPAPALPSPTPEPSCVDRVEDLPASSFYDASDPRLRGPSLLVVLKSKRRLLLFRHGRAAADGCWRIALGAGGPTGTKLEEGDLKTPEGWYRSSDKPWSRFRGAIAIHYPNASDARRGLRSGLIDRDDYRRILRALRRGLKPPQNTALGGEVLVHGGGASADWTQGCVALDDQRLEELRAALPPSKSVDILLLP